MLSKQSLPVRSGDIIPIHTVTSCPGTYANMPAENVLVSSRHPEGQAEGGWLCEVEAGERAWLLFDLGGTYPLGEMHVWNYSQYHPSYSGLNRRGLKDVRIEYSLDGDTWHELREEGYPYRLACAIASVMSSPSNLDDGSHSPIRFHNKRARYVKLIARGEPGEGNWGGFDGTERCYGLNAVQFYVGVGIAVVPEPTWTDLFHQQADWSGADGINSIPLNGVEAPGKADETNTLFLFGDTFVGAVDPATNKRLNTVMINNTVALLAGDRPDEACIQFVWNEGEDGKPESVFVPTTPRGQQVNQSYYWLQDGVTVNDRFYCFPLIVGPDENGAEGFQFAVYGVTRISVPIEDGRLVMEKQQQVDSPLFFTDKHGRTTYFGAAVFANTQAAQAPNPDGFVYVYGLKQAERVKLVVARVREEQFEDFQQWTYWDGKDWVADIRRSAAIADNVSCELSVSPLTGGCLDGKYVVAFQQGNTGHEVAMYVGESPIGPFANSTFLYHCTEPSEGKGIYVYNAKGHPHLSREGELLISYNVNTVHMDAHMSGADIYRPRFIRMYQINE